ncbi:MAG TPA: hypothetical protein VF572_04465 [Candidatus Saccharimonadales bacterium]
MAFGMHDAHKPPIVHAVSEAVSFARSNGVTRHDTLQIEGRAYEVIAMQPEQSEAVTIPEILYTPQGFQVAVDTVDELGNALKTFGSQTRQKIPAAVISSSVRHQEQHRRAMDRLGFTGLKFALNVTDEGEGKPGWSTCTLGKPPTWNARMSLAAAAAATVDPTPADLFRLKKLSFSSVDQVATKLRRKNRAAGMPIYPVPIGYSNY